MAAFLIFEVFVWMATAEYGVVGFLAGLVAGLAAGWLEVHIWPNAPCYWCNGKPRVSHSPFNPKAWRNCWWCKGSGRRSRVKS